MKHEWRTLKKYRKKNRSLQRACKFWKRYRHRKARQNDPEIEYKKSDSWEIF